MRASCARRASIARQGAPRRRALAGLRRQACLIAILRRQLETQLYLLAGGARGLRRGVAGPGSFALAQRMFTTIMDDLHDMPHAMRRLAVVQFFSWFALFAMWIYTTAAVTQVHFGASDPQSARVQRRRELGRRVVRGL